MESTTLPKEEQSPSHTLKFELLNYIWMNANMSVIEFQEDDLYYLRLAQENNLPLDNFKERYLQIAKDLLDSGESYKAKQFYIFFGKEEEFAAMLLADPNVDFTRFDSYMMAEKYGTTEQIDEAFALFYPAGEISDSNAETSDGKISAEKIKFNEYIKEFAKQKKVTLKRNIGISTVKALQYIESSKIYDCIVGVAHSGTPVAMATAGALPWQPTAVIEYHRRWQTPARLYKAVSNIQALQSAKRILLCDNDAITGETVSKVVERLVQSTTAKIDVLVSPVMRNITEDDLKAKVPEVENMIDTNTLPNIKVYSALLRYNAQLKKSL